MSKKVVLAYDTYDMRSCLDSMRNAAATAGQDLNIVPVMNPNELVSELRGVMDKVTVILSQTFAKRRFELNALEELRRLDPHGNIHIILIITRSREDASDEELTAYLRAGFFDVYFVVDVDSIKDLIATAWQERTAEQAYRYLNIPQPTEIRGTIKVPARDVLEGVDRSQKKGRFNKGYVFPAPIGRSRVSAGRRRVVAVCTSSSQVGASGLAMNLAIAVAAGGRKVSFQELPPERGYHVQKYVQNVILRPIQHAAELYRTGKPVEGENIAYGVSWYYELAEGISISPEQVDERFLMQYLLLPDENNPTILDVGSSFSKINGSEELCEVITDVVIAVRSERLHDDQAMARMERLLIAVRDINIRPIIVFLGEEPPRKIASVWREYANLTFYVNPDRTDEFGIMNGGEEELSAVISELGLFDSRVPDAPYPSAPVQMNTVPVKPSTEDVDFESLDELASEPKTFVPLFRAGKLNAFARNGASGNVIGSENVAGISDKKQNTAPRENMNAVVNAGKDESVSYDAQKDEMQKRITELAQANNELIANLKQANQNIEQQNHYIMEECVSTADYQVLRSSYDQLRNEHEALLNSTAAAGRDREALSTAVASAEDANRRQAEEVARLNKEIGKLNTALSERNNSIADLQQMLAFKEETLSSLTVDKGTAADKIKNLMGEKDALREQITSLENEVSRVESNLSSTAAVVDSLRAENEGLRQSITAAENAAVESRKEFDEKYNRKIQELKESASGDRAELLRKLQEAQAEQKALEEKKEEYLAQAREDAEQIRQQAVKDAETKAADAKAAVDAEYQKVLEKKQEVERARAEADGKLAQANAEAEKILADAAVEAEGKRRELLAYRDELINKQKEAEAESTSRIQMERAHLEEEQKSLAEREVEIDNRESDLKLLQGMLDKQKRQQDKEQERIAAEGKELEVQQKEFVKRVKDLTAQEEDAKDREARRAEKERRAIAKEAERADLHRLKMEERRKGAASGTTFFICLILLALVFAAMLFAVYKKSTDETARLRNEMAERDAQMITVLVANEDFPEGSVVTMSDFTQTTIRGEEGMAEYYVSSFSGTLTIMKDICTGQCLTTGMLASEQ